MTFPHCHRCPHCNQIWDHITPEPCNLLTYVACDNCQLPEAHKQAAKVYNSAVDRDRATLALRSKSSRQFDRGKRPIQESPLFGGTAQGGLFD